MADLDAQLAITADATGVETGVGKAKRSLNDLGRAGAEAGAKAGKGLDGVGDGAERASAKVKRAEANWVNSIQRTIAAAEAGSRANSKYFETIAQQRGIDVSGHKALLEQLDLVNAKQQASAVTMAKGATVLNAYGLSAKQTAAAMRGVPAQLTDIITSLQGGQAPLTVLLQQGGQLRDMFGGIVPAARALGGAVLGLVNPFTLTAAAVLGTVVAYQKGQEEAQNYAKALILSGNAAGVTAGQLQLMAQNIDGIKGTQAAAAEALATVAQSGAVSAENMEKFTLAAIRMEKVGGDSVSETAKKFAELKKAPLEVAVKLNESMNFLTRSTYEQIKALQEQGRTTEAAALAQKTFADTINDRAGQIEKNLGIIERGWRGIKSAISEAVDAALSIGRTAGPEVMLANAQRGVAYLEEQVANRRSRGLATGDLDRQLAAAREQVDIQRENVRFIQQAASGQAQQAAAVRAMTEFDKLREQSLSNQEKRAREIAKATQLAKESGASAADLAKVIANINEKYKGPKGPDTSRVDARAALQLEIEGIQQAAAAGANAIGNSERILEARRSAGLVQESAYYAEKRRMLEESTRIQVKALEDENRRLEQEKLNTKDGLDRDRKVLENKAQIAKLEAATATQGVILNIQEAAAIQAKTSALISARQAQEDYLQTVNLQQERALQMLGSGPRARDLQQGINQIEDRYASQRREVENQRALAAAVAGEKGLTEEQRSQFETRLKLIDEFQQKSTASYKDYYERLTKAQSDWSLGASEAIASYRDNAENLFQQTQNAVTNAMQGMEDALVKFVMTGKLSFSDLANSIVADITRIIIKQQMLNMLGGMFGGFLGTSVANVMPGNSLDNFINLNGGWGTIPGRASGGPVSPGRLYEVNEQAPELLTVGNRTMLMMGSQPGNVTPSSGIGGTNLTVHNSFYLSEPASRETQNQVASRAASSLQRASARMH